MAISERVYSPCSVPQCRYRRSQPGRTADRQPGTGKSHIAKAIAYQAILQSHKVQDLEADDFFHRYALSPIAQCEVRLRNIIDCDLLVLDDLSLTRTIPDDAGALLQPCSTSAINYTAASSSPPRL